MDSINPQMYVLAFKKPKRKKGSTGKSFAQQNLVEQKPPVLVGL